MQARSLAALATLVVVSFSRSAGAQSQAVVHVGGIAKAATAVKASGDTAKSAPLVGSTNARPAGRIAGIKAANDTATAATAQCKDGTYWRAKTRRGACVKHGGVARFLK